MLFIYYNINPAKTYVEEIIKVKDMRMQKSFLTNLNNFVVMDT